MSDYIYGAIGVAIIIVTIISPLIGLIFIKKGFKKAMLKANIYLLSANFFIFMPSLIISEKFDSPIADLFFGLVTFGIVIVLLISPIIALFFIKSGYKQAMKTANIVLLSMLIFIIFPIMIIDQVYSINPRVEEMDKKYTTMKNSLPKGESTTKILMDHWQNGSKSQRKVSFLINNYNNKKFKGKVIIHGYYDGKLINSKEVDIELEANEKGYEDYIYDDPFMVGGIALNRKIWRNLEIEYEFKGRFK